jgi:hypothetical protein
MRFQVLCFSAAVLLTLFGSAAAEGSCGIEAGSLFLEHPGKPRRAIELPGWHLADEIMLGRRAHLYRVNADAELIADAVIWVKERVASLGSLILKPGFKH